MGEIKREPIVSQNPETGNLYISFDEDHTHSDILRYLNKDLDWYEIEGLIDGMKEESAYEELNDGSTIN